MNNDLARVGAIALPHGICTMRLTGGASLKNARGNAGVALTTQHEALADTRATALLFERIWHRMCAGDHSRTLGTVSPVGTRQRAGRGSVAVRRGSTPVRRTIPKVELTKAHFDGTCVVLTGDLNLLHAASNRPLSRKLANELAAAARVEVASQVSSAVDYLVCADVDSASQEAQHARRKRIPTISEREFWEVLGIATRSR